MKKLISVLIVFSILIGSGSVMAQFAVEYNMPQQITGKFKSSSEFFVGESDFLYDDNDFSESSYIYKDSLAKMSIRFAMSAFSVNEDGYDKQYENAMSLLENLNFRNISWNESYTTKPETNSIGVIAGNKKIRFNDGEYTLIAVGIRGGNYEAEWGGNFNVGNGEIHAGFKIAQDKTLSFLKDYIVKNNISGNVKIWLTGYSRGGATVNLTAAYLDENPDCLGNEINLIPGNIYAYGFEVPAGVKNPSDDELYNNIFSIVNRNDFVPMLMMKKWNYGRYGITYYLPNSDSCAEYNNLKKQMNERYSLYVVHEKEANTENFSDCMLVWAIGKGIYLSKKESTDPQATEKYFVTIAEVMADTFVSNEEFSENYQNAFISFGTEIIGKERIEEFFNIFGEELISRVELGDIPGLLFASSADAAWNERMQRLFYDSVNAASLRLEISLEDSVSEVLFMLFFKLLPEHRLENLLGNIGIISQEHSPQLCMAWLDVSEKKNFTTSRTPKEISDKITVTVNGKEIEFDQPPVIENDRTLVPMRKIFEELGAKVYWDQESYTVTSIKEHITVKHTVGSNIIYVNNNATELDVASKIVNSRTLVPVRAVAESFNCNVAWDNDTRTVIITK